MSHLRWLAEHAENGTTVFRIGRDGDELIAEWVGLARLVARRDGSWSRLEVIAGADPRVVEKIERGSARLLLRQLGGRLALHGAAVARGGRAVVLLGRSGDGKSTLAAWLCTRKAATLFADDAVVIDEPVDGGPGRSADDAARWVITAEERDHWLDDAARRAIHLDAAEVSAPAAKLPVRAARAGIGVARVHALVALSFGDATGPRTVRLRGIDALAAVVPQAVRFVLDEPAVQRTELDMLARLVETVPVFRLERPRDLARLDVTASLLEDILMSEMFEMKDPPP